MSCGAAERLTLRRLRKEIAKGKELHVMKLNETFRSTSFYIVGPCGKTCENCVKGNLLTLGTVRSKAGPWSTWCRDRCNRWSLTIKLVTEMKQSSATGQLTKNIWLGCLRLIQVLCSHSLTKPLLKKLKAKHKKDFKALKKLQKKIKNFKLKLGQTVNLLSFCRPVILSGCRATRPKDKCSLRLLVQRWGCSLHWVHFDSTQPLLIACLTRYTLSVLISKKNPPSCVARQWILRTVSFSASRCTNY